MAETFLEDVFLNIPSPIIMDILSRLPPKEAVRCCCVCKAWLKLIYDTDFVNMHLSKSPTWLILLNLSSIPPDSPSISLVEVDDEIDHHAVRPIAQIDSKIKWSKLSIGSKIIDSMNGLVCIAEYANQYELVHVWNPIMGEYVTIQTPGGKHKRSNVSTYGFGISSGKYRLVKIIEETECTDPVIKSRRFLDSSCHVYTIGEGSWKNIGPAPYQRLYHSCDHGLFLNGNIHWLIYNDDDPKQICCLNLDTVLFQSFPPLPELGCRDRATLNIYQGYVSVCDNTSHLDMVVWVMKDYGLPNSWSKELVISMYPNGVVGRYCEDIHIIQVFKDGKALIISRDDTLYSYHTQRKTWQVLDVEVSISGPSNVYSPYIKVKEHLSSIVSLKDLGEVNVKGS